MTTISDHPSAHLKYLEISYIGVGWSDGHLNIRRFEKYMFYMKNRIKNIVNTHNASIAHTCEALTTPRNRGVESIVRHAEVSEKSIERYLVEQAKQNGMLCLKYSNPNMVGYPDRLLLLPGGGVIWVELKSKGRKPAKIQQIRMAELAAMGHLAKVIDNKADIDELIKTSRQ